jgi:hypothetical protein
MDQISKAARWRRYKFLEATCNCNLQLSVATVFAYSALSRQKTLELQLQQIRVSKRPNFVSPAACQA